MKHFDQDLLRAALTGYEFELEKVEASITKLRQQLNGRGHIELVRDAGARRNRKPFSAETRRKMAAAQRRRWKKSRAGES